MSAPAGGVPPPVSPGRPDGTGPPAGEGGPEGGALGDDPARGAPDPDASWLWAELNRRMAANRSPGGGRHARAEDVDHRGGEPAPADLQCADDEYCLTDPETESGRIRVVLSERKRVAHSVRTVVDVTELTPVGDLLRTNLIGNQLGVAVRVAAVAVLSLGVLPVLFALFPQLGLVEVLGLRLPWLLLGVLVYPFLLGLGWWHVRSAEKIEQEFADVVQS